jgi:hypothetical protein
MFLLICAKRNTEKLTQKYTRLFIYRDAEEEQGEARTTGVEKEHTLL